MAQHLSGPSSLAGQVALITGGSGGMGRAIANAFKSAGAATIATDLGEREDIGPGIEYRRYDVTSRLQTDQVIDQVLAAHGKVDILVLCAGIIARTPLAQSTDEEWNSMLSVNVLGVVNPTRKLFPLMCERGFGKILACGFDRRKEWRRRFRPRLCGLQGRCPRNAALDGQGGRAARCLRQHARARAGGNCNVGKCHEQSGAGGERDRSVGPLRQRGRHRAGGAVPVLSRIELDNRHVVGYQRRHVDGLKQAEQS